MKFAQVEINNSTKDSFNRRKNYIYRNKSVRLFTGTIEVSNKDLFSIDPIGKLIRIDFHYLIAENKNNPKGVVFFFLQIDLNKD